MSVKLLTEQCYEFLNLKGGWTGSSESILVKMPHSWKSRDTAQSCINPFQSRYDKITLANNKDEG